MTLCSSTIRRSISGSGVGLALVGTLLIASTYGMARFGVGLFAPRLGAEHPDLVQVLGYAGAAQFVSYSLAAGVAGRLADRRPRLGLALAGSTAALGCLGVALAATPGVFVAAVFVGGMGAGFASPAMVRVVDATVSDRTAPTAQALVNTGTAFGVVGAGALAFAITSTGAAWLVMAGLCAVPAAGVLLLLGRRSGLPSAPTGDAPRPSGGPGRAGSLAVPTAAAVVVGAGSAVIWTFGPTLATAADSVPAAHVGWLWVALGVGGLAGPSTGAVVGRLGPAGGWRLCAAVLAVSDLVLVAALVQRTAWPAYVAMALFGAGYLCLTGVLILWARAVRPAAAGAATAVLFIALAVGQALGSLAVGAVRVPVGATGVLLAAAVLCAVGGELARTRRVSSPAT